MANMYTLLLRFGSMVAPKVCSSVYHFDALVDFACSKWYELNGQSFGFSYVMGSIGECFLKDDDDTDALFVLATQLQVIVLSLLCTTRVSLLEARSFFLMIMCWIVSFNMIAL